MKKLLDTSVNINRFCKQLSSHRTNQFLRKNRAAANVKYMKSRRFRRVNLSAYDKLEI